MLRMLRKSSLVSLTLTFIFSSSLAFANATQQAKAPEHPSVAAESTAKAPQSNADADANLPNAYEMTPKAKAGKVEQPSANNKPSAVIQKPAVTQPAQSQPATEAKQVEKQVSQASMRSAVGSADQAPAAAVSDKATVDSMAADHASVDSIAAGKTTASDKPSATAADKASASAADKTSVDSATADQTSLEKASTDQASADLEVVDFVLAGKVESREPQDVVEAFSKDNERGFAFARLHAKAPSEVTFVWYRDDKPVARFKQPIQAAKKWRTYSSVKLRPGQWKVQLLNEDKVLAEKTFTIE